MLVSKIKEIKNGRVITKDAKTKDSFYDVFAKRDGRRQKFNNKPLALEEANELVEHINKAGMPSVEKGSAERVIIMDSKTKDEEKYFVRFIWNGEEKGVTLYASQLAQVGGFKSSPEESAKKYMEKLFSPDVKVISVSSLGKDSKTRDGRSVEEIQKEIREVSNEIDKIVLSGGRVTLTDPLTIKINRLRNELRQAKGPKDSIDPTKPKNIAAAKNLSKAQGQAASDGKSKGR